jgi:hypothetical protein
VALFVACAGLERDSGPDRRASGTPTCPGGSDNSILTPFCTGYPSHPRQDRPILGQEPGLFVTAGSGRKGVSVLELPRDKEVDLRSGSSG